MSEHGVVLFHTTSSAFRAERVLRAAGLEAKLIPTPREFSSDCGMALRFRWADHERVEARLHEAEVETAEVNALGP
jgi:hypothetical protein